MTSEERRAGRYARRKAAREAKRAETARYWDNYRKVFTYGHLYDSARICKRGVNWKATVQRYGLIPGQRVTDSYTDLRCGKVAPVKFQRFAIYERGHLRHIKSVGMRTRVEQRTGCDHALMPAITRHLIYDCGACVKGKGQTFSERRFMRHLCRTIKKYGTDAWVLFYDFHGYFDSIDHARIKAAIGKLFHDRRLTYVFGKWVDAFRDPGCAARGLGLGSQISQGLALEHANGLDHAMKEGLRFKDYGRYNDDGYAFAGSKQELEQALDTIRAICDSLDIELNEKKTRIQKITQPMHYLKKVYKVTPTGRVIKLVSRKSKVRQRRKLKKLAKKVRDGLLTVRDAWQSFQSWRSGVKRARGYNAIKNMMRLFNSLFSRRWRFVLQAGT